MSGRLLVIEDDIVHGAVLRLVAEKAGYAVTVAASIARAMERLQASDFDCVTLDLSLGELSGIQALEAFSRLNVTLPIIIISGADAEQCEAAVTLGKSLKLNILAPVSKPVELGALHSMLVAIRDASALQQAPAVSRVG